jgi:hypothetical protein
MHCPRCGQQQVSEDTKFCSRCGLPLGIVAEVLAHEGFLPQLNDLQKSKKWITRNLGLKLGLLWFVFFSIVLVPFAAITNAPEEIVAGFALIGFGGAVLISLLSWLFLTNDAKKLTPVQNSIPNQNIAPQYVGGNRKTTALPPQTSQPVSKYVPPVNLWKAPDTSELVPHSVTDHTTKLLQKDE